MSNINKINSQSNLDYIDDELFTELTPEAAEVFQGGASFAEGLSFTNFQHTEQRFYVPRGGTISIDTNTKSNLGYRRFAASIYNLGTGRSNTKTVDIGSDSTTWTNLRGGNYVILFEDPDADLISGSVLVNYT